MTTPEPEGDASDDQDPIVWDVPSRWALVEAMERHGLGKNDIARVTKCTYVGVHRWVAGSRRPRYEVRKLLHQHLGVPVDGWLTPKELERAIARRQWFTSRGLTPPEDENEGSEE